MTDNCQNIQDKKRIAELEALLAKKDTQIAQQEKKIAKQDKKIAKQDKKIAKQDKKIANQDERSLGAKIGCDAFVKDIEGVAANGKTKLQQGRKT